MKNKLTRRDTLKLAVATGAGFWMETSGKLRSAQSPGDRLNVAVIGVGGQGRSNLNAVAGQHVVALCDVDEQRAGDAYERFPQARKFEDFRRMFDQMASQIDAVVVSTPDHTHFHPCWMALQLGKHVYCEKPMAHSMWEVRTLTRLAAEKGVATQLGVQRHTLKNIHRVVELIQSGAIGQVRECHCWIDGERGMPPVPTQFPAVPSHLNWDLWLGPAAERPYSPEYCPYKWRFWWDFGTGETGNWGCHILDIPYWALGLEYPSHVEANGPEVDPQRSPKSLSVRYVFPPRGERPEVILHWHHARQGPPILRERQLPAKGNNTLFLGSEGMLLCGFGQRKLYPEEKFTDATPPEESIADSPGFHREWFDACRGGPPATCNFDYSGPLTETVLLGNVAYRAGSGFAWQAESLRAQDNARAQELIAPHFRPGWEI